MPHVALVAEVGEELKRLPQVLVGRAVVAEAPAHVAELAVHVGERVPVAEPARGERGGALHREQLVQGAAPVEQRRPVPGELPAVLVLAPGGGLLDDVVQDACSAPNQPSAAS